MPLKTLISISAGCLFIGRQFSAEREIHTYTHHLVREKYSENKKGEKGNSLKMSNYSEGKRCLSSRCQCCDMIHTNVVVTRSPSSGSCCFEIVYFTVLFLFSCHSVWILLKLSTLGLHCYNCNIFQHIWGNFCVFSSIQPVEEAKAAMSLHESSFFFTL